MTILQWAETMILYIIYWEHVYCISRCVCQGYRWQGQIYVKVRYMSRLDVSQGQRTNDRRPFDIWWCKLSFACSTYKDNLFLFNVPQDASHFIICTLCIILCYESHNVKYCRFCASHHYQSVSKNLCPMSQGR